MTATTGAITVRIVGQDRVRAFLRGKHAKAANEFENAVRESLLRLQAGVQERISGSGPKAVLNKRTGTLFRSIHVRNVGKGFSAGGVVGTPVIYAKTHELGLTITYPKRGTTIKFPRRAFVAPTFEEQQDAIVRRLSRAVTRALEGGE